MALIRFIVYIKSKFTVVLERDNIDITIAIDKVDMVTLITIIIKDFPHH